MKSWNEASDATSTNKDITVTVCLEAWAYSKHPLVTLDRYGLGRASARDKAAVDGALFLYVGHMYKGKVGKCTHENEASSTCDARALQSFH